MTVTVYDSVSAWELTTWFHDAARHACSTYLQSQLFTISTIFDIITAVSVVCIGLILSSSVMAFIQYCNLAKGS